MSERLKPSVSVSGGNPAGFPDYRPINKLSDSERKELTKPRFIVTDLYQVVVRERKGDTVSTIRIGPKIPEAAAHAFCNAIKDQISCGNEKTWSDPLVIPV